MGGLGDTGQPGPKKPIKVAGTVSFFKAFLSTFAEKYTLEKDVFFRSLARVPFFRFLSLWGSFGGALWKGFCANIDCSLESATSQKAWF